MHFSATAGGAKAYTGPAMNAGNDFFDGRLEWYPFHVKRNSQQKSPLMVADSRFLPVGYPEKVLCKTKQWTRVQSILYYVRM